MRSLLPFSSRRPPFQARVQARRPERERLVDPFERFGTRDYWLAMMPYAPDHPLVRSRRTSLAERA